MEKWSHVLHIFLIPVTARDNCVPTLGSLQKQELGLRVMASTPLLSNWISGLVLMSKIISNQAPLLKSLSKKNQKRNFCYKKDTFVKMYYL